jgi:asparagine N-glycosylation enzyme membrane subunit Stt3
MARRLQGFAAGPASGGGIMGPWDRGHHLRYFSGLPVVATPFGTDLAPDALDDWARFLAASDPDQAAEVLSRRQVRWLLVTEVEDQLSLAAALLPDAPAFADRESGHPGGPLVDARAEALVVSRLATEDGVGGARGPPLDGFRLMDEDALSPDDPPAKLFEVVRGAALMVGGAPPGVVVHAFAQVTAPDARSFKLELRALSDETGHAVLRAPYSTGANGRVLATPWLVTADGPSAVVQVEEPAVRAGTSVAVRLR